MRFKYILPFLLLFSLSVKAQYKFTGHIDNKQWNNYVYLSIIDDYRKITGVYSEQIIARVKTDSLGYFMFSGDEIENDNRIYRIHVDNCFDEENANHFNGHCDKSKEIVFIAKNTDTIAFPFSFENEMFCDIQSNNQKANALIKIDSLKDEMKFAFSEFRSEANRKLNNKKWFKTLQTFGKQLNEPIAELYIYAFLSDRKSDFHTYYLEDLQTNPYYDDLLDRLVKKYPNASYTKQYKTELTSDQYILSQTTETSRIPWLYIIVSLLILSLITNIYFWFTFKKKKSAAFIKDQLTKQEQNILNLILEDKTNKEIADALFVSISTVKTHVNNIFKKLQAQSRDEVKSLFNS
ncbi:helix-turn-helix domain-containing protein [Yeosuana marina]|uniref:helix-turn-helix domain-containing protein n=1 Tax=Yeosuana marina TaxID=1565536 RepID=UPI001420C87A|nr:helix-turn-helix transcriptional regulator [Yeosuana marina]